MTTRILDCDTNLGESGNVTIRRTVKNQDSKMAVTLPNIAQDHHVHTKNMEDSLFVDSILSQNETEEVERMLEIEGEISRIAGLGYGGRRQGFLTSTQMTRMGTRRASSLILSPIIDASYVNPSCGMSDWSLNTNNRFAALTDEVEEENQKNHPGYPGSKVTAQGINPSSAGECYGDPDMRNAASNGVRKAGYLGDDHDNHDNEHDNDIPWRNENNNVAESEEEGLNPNDPNKDNELSKGNEAIRQLGSELTVPADEEGKGKREGTIESWAHEDKKVEDLEKRSTRMEDMLTDLRSSLEFSQKEIDDLKSENLLLRRRLEDIEMEEERSVYQLKKIEDKVDKVETSGKKRNLVIEGMPEIDGGREDINKVIWTLFDQMNIGKDIEIDTCYRVGAYSKRRTRPISVSFVRQSDRDLVYSRRMNLGRSRDFRKVWVNEDLGAQSKKARNMVRMITKQAEIQGVDHKTGKYAIHVDRVRYDENNFDDLPANLTPASVKQVQIDDQTIAYQSKHAPYSNFHPSTIGIGERKFNCAEQAYHYIKAKTMSKHLIAARIYLSRDPEEMKKLGEDIGTTDLWEAKKFDTMYFCIKAKFEQNPDLLELLLKSGDCEMVEATPSRLWGCGATLSSNVLKKQEWQGENRHGKILMTVREELRHTFG